MALESTGFLNAILLDLECFEKRFFRNVIHQRIIEYSIENKFGPILMRLQNASEDMLDGFGNLAMEVFWKSRENMIGVVCTSPVRKVSERNWLGLSRFISLARSFDV